MSDDPKTGRTAGTTAASPAEGRLWRDNLRLRAELLREMPLLEVGGRTARPTQADDGVGASEGAGDDMALDRSLRARIDAER